MEVAYYEFFSIYVLYLSFFFASFNFFSPFCFLYIFSFLVLLELEQVTNELFSLIIEKDNINNYFLLNFFQKIDGGFVLTHPICSL